MTTITTQYPFVGSIDTKQGGRSENQDNAGFVDTPLGFLLVVCDGMGGGPGGRTASLMAVDTVLSVLAEVSERTPRKEALDFAISKANDIIYSKSNETPELRGMGTTIAAILLNEDSAVVAHAGDTRVYQLRKGNIAYRSSDHSVVANYVRQNKLTEEEARNHPQSNIVTRALGIRPSMEVEFDEISFQRGDRFVVCTDGIWGMMPERDFVQSLSRIMGIDELTTTITEEIDKIGREKGNNHDNLTIAVVDSSFDSKIKKLKKNHNAETLPAKGNWKTSKCSKYRSFFTILLVCLASAVLTLAYFNNDWFTEDNERIGIGDFEKGPTVTTVSKSTIKKHEEIPDSHPQKVSPQHVTSTDNGDKNVFTDSVSLKLRNQEIAKHISLVLKSLDSLKRITGKGQQKVMGRKRSFVEKNIIPDVSKLKKKVDKSKLSNVDEIIGLLKKKKTVSCTKNGQPTKEGNSHIDTIKAKISNLNN